MAPKLAFIEIEGRRSERAADRVSSAARTWLSAAFRSERCAKRLLQSFLHGDRRSGRERDIVGKLVLIRGRQACQAREIDLLFRKIILQREQPLLLGQRLHLTSIRIDLGDQADVALLQGLLIDGVGCVQLSLRGVHSGFRGQHLKIGSADGENHQILRVKRGQLIRTARFRSRNGNCSTR